jgi:cystathionine beta-synthase
MISEEELISYTKDTSKCTWKPGTTEPSPHHRVPFIPHPKKIMDSILDAVGYTPLIRLNNIPKAEGVKCEILVKCEFFSAGGSIKDRIGKRMVLEAERTGRIKKGDTLIEPTSGNTGVGLALAAIVQGYKMIVTLPDKMSNEKVDILKGLGSEVIRTPTEAPMESEESYVGLAQKLQRELPNAHMLYQYKNPDNPLAHYDETAEEILFQTDKKLDVIVLSAGTGGTVTGIGRKIREATPEVKILAVDPEGSILSLPKEMNSKGTV